MLDRRRSEAGPAWPASRRRPLAAAVVAAVLWALWTASPAVALWGDPHDPPGETTTTTTTTTTTAPSTTTTTRPPTTAPPPSTAPETTAPPPPVEEEEEEPPPVVDEPVEDEVEEAEVVEVAAEPVGELTFTTVHNLLVPGNGIDENAQATTTTTAQLASGGADDESRTIWMIIVALAVVGVLVAVLTWRYWLLTRPNLDLDDEDGDDEPDQGEPPRGRRRSAGPADPYRDPVGPPTAAARSGPGEDAPRRRRGGGRERDPFWDEPPDPEVHDATVAFGAPPGPGAGGGAPDPGRRPRDRGGERMPPTTPGGRLPRRDEDPRVRGRGDRRPGAEGPPPRQRPGRLPGDPGVRPGADGPGRSVRPQPDRGPARPAAPRPPRGPARDHPDLDWDDPRWR